MEENVALDSKKQKKFVKSIKGIKKLLKKHGQNEVKSDLMEKNECVKQDKPFSMRLKSGKVHKRKPMKRGLVYLSHIPHGFYEHQMTEYFKQFGVVTNARVIKSKRTGKSKGYAFVEFKEPSVAQVVAETMNNYLMGKRLIKAAYIPPEKIKRNAFRKKWNTVHNPTSIRRMKFNKRFNEDKDDKQNLQKARRLLSNLNKTKKKLMELGINYDFFTPVDVPAELLDSLIKKEKEEDTVKVEGTVKDEDTVKEESNPKKRKKEKNEQKEVIAKVMKLEKVKNGTQLKEVSKDNLSKNVNKENQLNKKKKEEPKQEKLTKGNKKDKKPVVINQKEQKIKEKQLKAGGVKSVEQFININEEDSDSSCDFDSDEYEKMLEEDDDDD